MKKLPFYFCFFTFAFLLSAAPVFAGNKIGVHIGDHFDLFDQAASVVGSGGWIVVMACPGDGDALAKMVQSHPEVNLIIRGHYPGQPLNRDWALSWAATIGSLPTNNKIFFMPWNEPNQAGSGDWGNPNEVVAYINDVVEAFNKSGLRGKKVALLSPMLNHTWVGGAGDFDTYVRQLRSIDDGFFRQFDGIAMNLYDFGEEICGSPLCADDPHFNPAKFSELLSIMGASGKSVFGVESGTAGQNFYWRTAPTSNSPLYRFVQAFATKGEKMFAIPAYDLAGERGHNWSLFEPPDVVNLMKSLTEPSSPESGSTPGGFEAWRDANAIPCPGTQYAYAISEAYCGECGGAVETHSAPIGYLDQMNITAEKEIDPCQSLKAWYWAECYRPSEQSWDMDCIEALNKMGFSSDAFLCYPLWLQEWRDYILRVLPRFTPYERLDEVVERARELINSPAQGWVEFVTSGENHDTKRTKITNPRILFGANFVRELSFATDFIWSNLTPLQQQRQKPILVRDGRDSYPGWESPCNNLVDFGAYSPQPGFFGANKFEGSCHEDDKWCGGPCEDDRVCQKDCYYWKEDPDHPLGGYFVHRYKKEDVWTMRQVNPEIPTHDTIETLNPGWPELANTWSNIANPINGFIPAIAVPYGEPIKREGFCDDLFGEPEDLKDFDLAFSSGVDPAAKPSLCSWRYANTPFAYLYGPEGNIQPHGCAEYIDPDNVDESKAERQCFAHWPFVGGLRRVYEFIADWTNVYEK